MGAAVTIIPEVFQPVCRRMLNALDPGISRRYLNYYYSQIYSSPAYDDAKRRSFMLPRPPSGTPAKYPDGHDPRPTTALI